MPLGGESIVNLIDYRSIGGDGLKALYYGS
jgi:hypothetical protein